MWPNIGGVGVQQQFQIDKGVVLTIYTFIFNGPSLTEAIFCSHGTGFHCRTVKRTFSRLPFDSHAIVKSEKRKGQREMKTGAKQRGVRQDIRPIQAPFSAKNHPRNTLIQNAIRVNPAQSASINKTHSAPPPLPLFSGSSESASICLHLRLKPLSKTENYQTNPFVIFQFAHEFDVLRS